MRTVGLYDSDTGQSLSPASSAVDTFVGDIILVKPSDPHYIGINRRFQ